jgi:hypothetical protein
MVNWSAVDRMWPGTFEDFDAWVDAFTQEHGYPPWSGSFNPTAVLEENIAARDWGIRFMQQHGRPPTEREYQEAWYEDRFGLGPYDYSNPDFWGAPLGAGWGKAFAYRWGPEGWGEPWYRPWEGGGSYRRARAAQGLPTEPYTSWVTNPGRGV